MSKYHARKVVVDGIQFDSRKEANRWTELRLLERAGAISELQRQVRYLLIPAHYEAFERYGKDGKRLKDGRRCVERAVWYVADFQYVQDGKTIVEDVKGLKTKEYILKRKMLLHFRNIKIKEV